MMLAPLAADRETVMPPERDAVNDVDKPVKARH
jgi:hypothetical protein